MICMSFIFSFIFYLIYCLMCCFAECSHYGSIFLYLYWSESHIKLNFNHFRLKCLVNMIFYVQCKLREYVWILYSWEFLCYYHKFVLMPKPCKEMFYVRIRVKVGIVVRDFEHWQCYWFLLEFVMNSESICCLYVLS